MIMTILIENQVKSMQVTLQGESIHINELVHKTKRWNSFKETLFMKSRNVHMDLQRVKHEFGRVDIQHDIAEELNTIIFSSFSKYGNVFLTFLVRENMLMFQSVRIEECSAEETDFLYALV
ncbi:hypothetical protein CN357_03815 [Bacillus cereus]|uniref:Uncharacterized protein n=2 Tax=Bacillus TaxID=1386 RepID=A0A9X6W2K7_BACCE|nr:hypothetical protein CN357_03815 [Bacillus cereus]PFQ27752.1 hypothetical protein COK33_31635 [Bacillus cereus]PGB10047.1 hypothetical protein COM09_23530 [Bacillus toyonensis]